MPEFLTIADLEAATGGNMRQLRLMADAGAIQPLPATQHAGRGNHRLFTQSEMFVASVLVALAPFRFPIGPLTEIGSIVRGLLALGSFPPDLGLPKMPEAIEAAKRGVGDAFLVITPTNPEDAAPTRQFSMFVSKFPSIPATPGSGTRRPVAVVVDLRRVWETLK